MKSGLNREHQDIKSECSKRLTGAEIMGYRKSIAETAELLRQMPRQEGDLNLASTLFTPTVDPADLEALEPVLKRLLRAISSEFGPLGYGVGTVVTGSLLHGEPDLRWIARLAQARDAETPDASRRAIGDLVDDIVGEIAPFATQYRLSDAEEWGRARRNAARAAFEAMRGAMAGS